MTKPIKTRRAKKTESVDLYQKVTDRIVEALENGVAPWKKPWRTAGRCAAAGPLPVNALAAHKTADSSSTAVTGGNLSSRHHSLIPFHNRKTVEIKGKVIVVRSVTMPLSPLLSSLHHSRSLQGNGMMTYRFSDTVTA